MSALSSGGGAGGGSSSSLEGLIPEIPDRLRESGCLVLSAPPGTGKSTLAAPAIVESGLLPASHPRLILLQPRRVAARAVARRIAETRGWRLGGEVGYVVRGERRAGAETRLLVATEGVLTRMLTRDPFLEGVGAVALDEFHERSVHTDLAIAMLREVRESAREDLRILAMSATLDTGEVSRFLWDAPVVRAEARTHPVRIEHASGSPSRREIPEAAAREAVRLLWEEPEGDVLVFLPGAEEIRRAIAAAGALLGSGSGSGSGAVGGRVALLGLHGGMGAEEQDRALRPDAGGRRRIVFATNVAETSVTIEGVRAVVDSGLAKYARMDTRRGLDRLETGRISKASAEQRAGRAGRLGPGRCARLWSLSEHRGLPDFDVAEIHRVDPAPVALAVRAFGHADVSRFGWFEAPSGDRLEAADRLLGLLGAIDPRTNRLSALGRELAELPIPPRAGRLLSAARAEGFARTGAALAALLSEKDLLTRGGRFAGSEGEGDCDLFPRLDALEEAEASGFGEELRGRGIDPTAARRVARARDELLRAAGGHRDRGAGDRPESERMLRWLLSAYPDRVARRRRAGEPFGLMAGGRGVRLEAGSVVRDWELFLALDPFEDAGSGRDEANARVGLAAGTRAEWLAELFPEHWSREKRVEYDEARGRAVGVALTRFLDLVIEERPNVEVEAEEASRALSARLAARASEWIGVDAEASEFLARVEFLRGARPELGLPEFDEARLRGVLERACAGFRTEEEARGADLGRWLRGELDAAGASALEREAPTSLTLPNGRRGRVRYESGRGPWMSVKLQDLLGWRDAPRLAGGRAALTLEILGPHGRPVQVTSDLRGFWTGSYALVRKDLRGRYPKHAWPERPIDAPPDVRNRR